MANGRVFLALCFTVHLMFILNKISLHKDETTSENYNGLLYFKIKSSLSCIGADGSGLYWCCSRDKILRRRLGVGVKYAFNLDFNQFPESTLQTAPNSDLYPLEELQRILSEVSTSELIVVGDFNITEIDWSNASTSTISALPNLLLDIVHDNFLSQMIFEPTRDKNILDLVTE